MGALDALLCSNCQEELPWLGPACRRCAQPTTQEVEICSGCAHWKDWHLDRCHSALRYEGSLRDWLLRFKFQRKTGLRRLLSLLFAEGLRSLRPALSGMLVPVPLSRQRLRERRYNQAQLLAESLRNVLSELQESAGLELRRVRQGRSQAATLEVAQRRKNVQDIFEAKVSRIPERIWLVDDVMTSGATLNEAARVLKAEGAPFVGSLTLARRLLDHP